MEFIMTKLNKCSLAVAIALVANVSSASDVDGLAELSLDDLLNLSVSGVSKKQESVDRAPGVVTVVTASQIKALGAKNLTDVLKTVPGVFAFDNYFSLTDQFSIRGNLSEDYNTKILFLINGHPSYHTLVGTFFSDMVPLDAVERVEVVRGPVSVLYGTNALTGVINVITKKDFGESGSQASIEFASHSTKIAKMSTMQSLGSGQLVVSGEIKRTDGFDQEFTAEEDDSFTRFKAPFLFGDFVYAGDGGIIELGEEHTSLFSQYQVGDFELDISYFDQERKMKQGIQPSLYFRSEKPFEIDLFALDSRYRLELSEEAALRFIARYDDYGYKYSVGNYHELDNGLPTDGVREAVGDWKGSKYGLEMIADIAYDSWDLIAGVMWDEYKADKVNFKTGEPSTDWAALAFANLTIPLEEADFPLIREEVDNNDVAVYANGRYRFTDAVEGVAGFRYTDNDLSGGHLDYRIGGIFNVGEHTVIKALWGTSYRSANLNEYNVSATPVILGNRDLDFEVLEGFDLAVINKGDNYSLTLNYFMNETDKEIAARPALDPNVGFDVPTYTNVKGKETHGIEYDFTYLFSSDVHFYLKGSHLFDVEDVETGESIKQGTIRTMKAMGLKVKWSDNFDLDLGGIYNGDWNGDGAYYLYTFAADYRVTEQINVYMDVQNLTDEDYTYSIWQGAWESERIPAADPRVVTVGMRYSF